MMSSTEETSSEFGNSQKLLAALIDAPCPLGVPLVAKYKQGFGYKTIGHRLPVILTKVIDHLSQEKNAIGEVRGMEARCDVKVVTNLLAKLKNELQTNKPITPINHPVWDNYLKLVAERYLEGEVNNVRWYFAPWLYVECYMYKRISEALKAGTALLIDYDVFQKQKEIGWLESLKAAEKIGALVTSCDTGVSVSDLDLQKFLEISLWGNKCDLSISQGEQANEKSYEIISQLQELKKFVLADDSEQFWKAYHQAADKPGGKKKISFILDNAGFELFTDLCFADVLMRTKEDLEIEFHVKQIPWFVSDAMKKDFLFLLRKMGEGGGEILKELAAKWEGFLQSGRWRIVSSPFWTWPHSYNEMSSADPSLHSLLKESSLLIFKGDLNYRKLIGDLNWKPSTPFKEALQGFLPAPLLALRTLKADCVAGLTKGLAEEMDKKFEKDWMVSGEYGVVQFCDI